MRVAWFDARDWERAYLEQRDVPFDVDVIPDSLTAGTVQQAAGADAVSVFVHSTVDASVLEALEADLITTRSTGYDHIDLEAADAQGVTVCNVPDYGGPTVAEHTIGLLLALTRKIYQAVTRVQDGRFDHEGLTGMDLAGKTVGIVGTGSIGKNVITRLAAFEVDVLAYDPDPDPDLQQQDHVDYVDLDALYSRADVVSLHCPLTPETEHLLDADAFARMEDVVLINTARGPLIDTRALLAALEDGSVRSAGLDVLEGECHFEEDIAYMGDVPEECDIETLLRDHMLANRDDVLITPHNAFNSIEALHRIADTTVENLREQRHPVT